MGNGSVKRRWVEWVVIAAVAVAAAVFTAVPANAAPVDAAPADPAPVAAPLAEPGWYEPAKYRSVANTALCIAGPNAANEAWLTSCSAVGVVNTYVLSSPGCCYKGWWIGTHGLSFPYCFTAGPNLGDVMHFGDCSQSTETFFGLRQAAGPAGTYQLINHPGPDQPEDKCLQADGVTDGAKVVLGTCDANNARQRWTRV